MNTQNKIEMMIEDYLNECTNYYQRKIISVHQQDNGTILVYLCGDTEVTVSCLQLMAHTYYEYNQR